MGPESEPTGDVPIRPVLGPTGPGPEHPPPGHVTEAAGGPGAANAGGMKKGRAGRAEGPGHFVQTGRSSLPPGRFHN